MTAGEGAAPRKRRRAGRRDTDAASLAAENALGRWLTGRWGALADVDPELLDQISL